MVQGKRGRPSRIKEARNDDTLPSPMSPIPPSLQEALNQWLEYDQVRPISLLPLSISAESSSFTSQQNESTRKEIVELRDAQDWNELTKRLGSRIEFGTAGE